MVLGYSWILKNRVSDIVVPGARRHTGGMVVSDSVIAIPAAGFAPALRQLLLPSPFVLGSGEPPGFASFRASPAVSGFRFRFSVPGMAFIPKFFFF